MNLIKQRLKNGEMVLGTMISEVRNPNIAYMLAQSGFQYFIVDNEHGTYSAADISGIVAASRGAGLPVVVRIPEINRENILKPLDSGAVGLLVPQVDTADQAREVIRHAKYPPQGNRGVGLRRAHSLYGRVKASEYLEQANEDVFIAVQAETPTAIENLNEIAAVDGVDCIFAGPADLSVSLGIPGQLDHPREVEAIEKVIEACNQHNKAGGIMMFSVDALKNWINKGMRFAAYSSDISMLADSALNSVQEIKNTK